MTTTVLRCISSGGKDACDTASASTCAHAGSGVRAFALDARRALAVVFFAFFSFLFVSLAVSAVAPRQAHALTLAEIRSDISATQDEIEASEAKRDAAMEALGDVSSEIYKIDSAGSLLTTLISSDDIDGLIKNIEYLRSVGREYARAAQQASEASDELNMRLDELEELEAIEKAREEAWKEADKKHFPQGGGMPWSNLPYWGANVAWAGCGLCAYTSVVDILTGADYTPTEMLDIRGDWVGMESHVNDASGTPDGSTHHDFTLKTFGIESYESEIRDSEAFATELSKEETVSIVCARGTVFHNKDGSYRYTDGHYVCVYKYDDEGFHVHDPATQDANIIYTHSEMQRLLNGTSSVVFYCN